MHFADKLDVGAVFTSSQLIPQVNVTIEQAFATGLPGRFAKGSMIGALVNAKDGLRCSLVFAPWLMRDHLGEELSIVDHGALLHINRWGRICAST